jgi:hypothetical protein
MAFPIVEGCCLMEYMLDVFRCNGKDNRVVYRRRLWFVVQPTIMIVRSALMDFEDRPLFELEDEEWQLGDWLSCLKEYLFRKRLSPLTDGVSAVWDMHPEFSEDDKQALQRLYVLEEL